jgi:Na+/phosphate symporter
VWDTSANALEEYDDVRDIQKQLKEKSVNIIEEANESKQVKASINFIDSDGNVILINQHV